ncbi:hypothetical protein A2V49_04840 [candidate division WWE3 bacterium RBG_19FT_COMBO_34_6]|uniref:Bacterial toxin RNase RnlA/LsoA DBD domain-containing protein n=1 Tax=candidate division WWE3 bacterium RBG_19FT_COMBO_34_6 TaxID=1802612 RepID=A0A1F4UKP8_UNCKA|nr:MAG: hypothetical protein A2V49_04840 [candidate division WWE3 bacterium RBG_19FT_COMBO_34_6]
MQLIDRNSSLWSYLTDDLKGLISDGEILLEQNNQAQNNLTDYSYLVFLFSKAYEGFLKKLFLDLKFIREDEYYGDDIRIGRILNPRFLDEHENVFKKLVSNEGTGEQLAAHLWELWKLGRNQVFHYFPHNFRRLSYQEAFDIIRDLIGGMEDATRLTYIVSK